MRHGQLRANQHAGNINTAIKLLGFYAQHSGYLYMLANIQFLLNAESSPKIKFRKPDVAFYQSLQTRYFSIEIDGIIAS